MILTQEFPITVLGELSSGAGYQSLVKSLLYRLCRGKRVAQLAELFLMPPVVFSEVDEEAKKISVILLSLRQDRGASLVMETFSRWLLPEKRLTASLFFSADFVSEEKRIYTISEMIFPFSSADDLQIATQILPLLEEELSLSARSFLHASYVKEAKGLSLDEKSRLVQERVALFVDRFPQIFDGDLLSDTHQFLLLAEDEFKEARSSLHLSRMALLFYLQRTQLTKKREREPDRRHQLVHLRHLRVHHSFGVKRVLGLFVGITFIKERELFEERHLVRALQELCPDIKPVPGSYLLCKARDGGVQTIYLEVDPFSHEEIPHFLEKLGSLLSHHVEHLVSSLFMPRNEEEVMRHIVTLSNQLRYVQDIPQVNIAFDRQEEDELIFTVVVVRILLTEGRTSDEFLKEASQEGSCRFVLERVKETSLLRNRYPKEATVWKAYLKSDPFCRPDHSLDLFCAREQVKAQIQKALGEVRDYNGGMMSKQKELFAELQASLPGLDSEKGRLLEAFFYSIFPVEIRSFLNPDSLKSFFHFFLSVREEGHFLKNRLTCHQEEGRLFALFSLEDKGFVDKIKERVEPLGLRSPFLVSLHLAHMEKIFFGYLYFCEEKERQKEFLDVLEESLTFE